MEIELINKIKKHNKLLNDKLKEENEEEKFFADFLKNNRYDNVYDMIELDFCDLAVVLLRKNNQSLSITDLQDIIYDNENIFIDTSADDFIDVCRGINTLYEENKISKLKEVLLLPKKISKENFTNLLDQVFDINKDSQYNLCMMTNVLSDIDCDFTKILDLMESEPIEVINTFNMIAALKNIKHVLADYNKIIAEIEKKYPESKKRQVKKEVNKYKEKLLNEMLSKEHDIPLINRELRDINNYYLTIHKNETQKKRNIKKEIKNNETFISELKSSLKQDEITNVEKIINLIKDHDLRKETLKLIYTHNKKYYETLQEEYQNLSSNSKSKYQVLLNQLGLEQGKYSIETIMQKSYDEVEKMTAILINMKIKDPDTIATVLETSDLKRVGEINKLLNKEIINKNTAIKYNSIFDIDKSSYQRLLNNIDLFNKYNINPYYLENSQSELFLDSDIIDKNLSVLKEYKLIDHLNADIDYLFLGRDDLENQIDEILELGFEKELEENMNLLNISKQRWKRIETLKSTNIGVSSYKELIENLTTDKFLIPDDQLDGYIYNIVPYRVNNKLLQLPLTNLSNDDMFDDSGFDKTKRTYNINGTIISKNKVKRNFSKIKDIDIPVEEKILISLVAGSILNENEYKNIRKKAYSNVKK